MLGLEAVAPIQYRDPWQQPLATRLRQLAQGRHRVAYFYEQADNSTFRYRVYNMVQVLDERPGEVSAGYFFLEDLPRLGGPTELAARADQLVICRARYDHQIAQLVAAFKARGKPVFFDTDDLVFDHRYAHLILDTLDVNAQDPRAWDYWFAYTSRIGATLRLCDAAITTTAPLARRISEFADVPVAVVPNFLNREQMEYSDRLYAAKAPPELGESGLVHLGYFSGSPSHNRDFAMAVPALAELMDEDPQLGVVVVGYMDPGPLKERFGSRVTRFEFQDFLNLQRLIARVEYNLMPLQSNVFTHCKSELKFFDAAVVGTLSIASPTATYAPAIAHGHTGWLARSHEWAAVLRQALSQRHRYREMAHAAREEARAKYHWQVQRPAILAALGL